MSTAKLKFFLNSRLTIILFLAFSSGLPLALTNSTLQAWFTQAGISLVAIGALSLTGQPYLYKFLWAPLLDRFSLGRLGKRRGWILWMQFALLLSFAAMAFFNPETSAVTMAGLALIIAFFSATQDTAIDAYGTELLSSEERGIGAAAKTVGYRVAMLFSGAGALIMAAFWGFQITYLFMAVLMGFAMMVTWKSPRPAGETSISPSLADAVIKPWQDFIRRDNAILILCFIVLYKISDAFALTLNTSFLIRGMGFSLLDVGAISKTAGLSAALLGSIAGGMLYQRLGMYRSLLYFGFLQMFSNLSFALLSYVGKNTWVMASAIFSENFCSGLSTVAFVAFLMFLCNSRYTATQFALFSALASMSRVLAGPEAALMVEHVGWTQFYVWTFFMGFPSLLLLRILHQRKTFAIA
jgi:PAT family beta-lactamase induction signal transducer AmpG